MGAATRSTPVDPPLARRDNRRQGSAPTRIRTPAGSTRHGMHRARSCRRRPRRSSRRRYRRAPARPLPCPGVRAGTSRRRRPDRRGPTPSRGARPAARAPSGTGCAPSRRGASGHRGRGRRGGRGYRRASRCLRGARVGRTRSRRLRRAVGTISAVDGSPEGRGYHTKVLPPSLSDDERVAAIRELLPATSAGIYLNTGSVGPLPAETAAAMDEIATQELRTGRGHPDYWLETLERFAEARASLAAVLATDIDAIALTHSTTDGINTSVLALPWQAGDRVLTTNQEHAGVLGPLLSLRDRVGVEVVLVDIGEGRDDEATVRAFEKALERPARALVFSHVLWTTGALLPVERIAALGRERRAVTILDAAQSVGAMPVHPDDIGVD